RKARGAELDAFFAELGDCRGVEFFHEVDGRPEGAVLDEMPRLQPGPHGAKFQDHREPSVVPRVRDRKLINNQVITRIRIGKIPEYVIKVTRFPFDAIAWTG